VLGRFCTLVFIKSNAPSKAELTEEQQGLISSIS
jgi:hypothetical protein